MYSVHERVPVGAVHRTGVVEGKYVVGQLMFISFKFEGFANQIFSAGGFVLKMINLLVFKLLIKVLIDISLSLYVIKEQFPKMIKLILVSFGNHLFSGNRFFRIRYYLEY